MGFATGCQGYSVLGSGWLMSIRIFATSSGVILAAVCLSVFVVIRFSSVREVVWKRGRTGAAVHGSGMGETEAAASVSAPKRAEYT